MYSILIDERKRATRLVAIFDGEAPAKGAVQRIAAGWRKSKPGRKTSTTGLETRFYFSDGKMASVMTLDPLHTQTSGEPGPRKAAKGGAA